MARTTKRLTARRVETITAPGHHADGDGLYLVVDRSGSRRWTFIYHREGKRREMGLGRMSLGEARVAAEDARRRVRSGADPIESRRIARAMAAGVPSFAQVAAELTVIAKAKSSNAKVQYQWDLLLGPRYCRSILDRPVHEITTLEIEDILRPVWRDKPETGRKLLARLRRVFDYARIQLRDRYGIAMNGNPADWQDLRDRGFDRNRKLTRGHQPSLVYEQAPAFMMALGARRGMAARALELLLLTALRTGEVINARWDEIDFDNRIWIIPIDRLKDRRTRTEPHRVPLSAAAIELLRSLPRLGVHIFAGLKAGQPLSNMAMLRLLKSLNVDADGKPKWIDTKTNRPIAPHGLRATFRTWGEEAEWPRELLEESLGHQIGSAVERAYRRTDGLERRRKLMEAWAAYLRGTPAASVLSSANVSPLSLTATAA